MIHRRGITGNTGTALHHPQARTQKCPHECLNHEEMCQVKRSAIEKKSGGKLDLCSQAQVEPHRNAVKTETSK